MLIYENDPGAAYHKTDSVTIKADSSQNTITINDGIFKQSLISAGKTILHNERAQATEYYSTTNNNKLIINGGTFSGNFNAGDNQFGILSYGEQQGEHNGYIDANNNYVLINDGIFTRYEVEYRTHISSGYIDSSSSGFDNLKINNTINANNNIIDIKGGSLSIDIIGGNSNYNIYHKDGTTTGSGVVNANNNTINISGGSISGRVYAGYAALLVSNTNNQASQYRVNATNNTVNLLGNPIFDSANSEIWGGGAIFQDNTFTTYQYGDAFTGNTFNFSANPISLNKLGNFEFYNFNINQNIDRNDTLVSITNPVDISHSTISVKSIDKNSRLVQGDVVTLLNNVQGDSPILNDLQRTTIGTAKLVNVLVYQQDNAIKAQLENSGTPPQPPQPPQPPKPPVPPVPSDTNPQTKAYLEGRMVTMQMVNQSNDLIADLNWQQLQQDDNGVSAFGLSSGGKSRYNTGSHNDLKGFGLATGVTKSINKLTAGGLFEAGWGSYSSYNDFSGLPSVDGTGNTNYQGIGVIANYDLTPTIYLNGSLRGGRISTNFTTDDFGVLQDIRSRYDSSSAYVSAHLRTGYRYTVNSRLDVEPQATVLVTRVNSDSVNNSEDERLAFSNLNSQRINAGVSTTYHLQPQVDLISRVAYEYEFGSSAKGTIDGLAIDSPSLQGSTGVGELGVRWQANQNKALSMDAKLTGYVGKREGVAGGLNINYRF